MSDKEFEFERRVYRNTSSVVLAVALYVTTLGIAHPLLIYTIGIVTEAFVVGGIRGFRAGVEDSE